MQRPASGIGVIGTNEAVTGSGIFASFMDFKKALYIYMTKLIEGSCGIYICFKEDGNKMSGPNFSVCSMYRFGCAVKVGVGCSKLSEVSCGLRVHLSPWLFSLFINYSMVAKLQEAEVGVKFGSIS